MNWLRIGHHLPMELASYCRAGDLAALRAYCDRAGVTAAQVRASHALQVACRGGHLEVARWLQQTFQLTAAEACAEDNWALRWACECGYLEIAHWLQQTFQLTAADARAVDNYALRGACEGGHLEVACWLQRTFQLTAADAYAQNYYALCMACTNNHPEILRWMQRTWGIPTDTLAYVLVDFPKISTCVIYLRSLCALCWSPRTHADFPLPVRSLALYLLLINQRLTRELSALPYLPPELWLHLLSYLPTNLLANLPTYWSAW